MRATRRCLELLESGGVYITFENIRPTTAQAVETGLRRWRQYQLAQGRSEAETANHMARFDTAYFPITISQHLALLETCGFADPACFWLSYMQAGFFAIKP
jgi:tRNA (cmo5U34)-methyltransferase